MSNLSLSVILALHSIASASFFSCSNLLPSWKLILHCHWLLFSSLFHILLVWTSRDFMLCVCVWRGKIYSATTVADVKQERQWGIKEIMRKKPCPSVGLHLFWSAVLTTRHIPLTEILPVLTGGDRWFHEWHTKLLFFAYPNAMFCFSSVVQQCWLISLEHRRF